MSSSLRSPQGYRGTGSAPNSDEINTTYSGIPQRPPRQNRQRSGSSSNSPIMTSHYQSQQQDPYYSPPTRSYSPRPSPLSTPIVYGSNYQGSHPSSPAVFALPPSALSAREDSLPRSAPIQFQPQTPQQYHQYQQYPNSSSSSSYRSPHISPGLSSSANMSILPPPLSLPESFLDDPDYAGYYTSDVGILSGQQIMPSSQHLQSPLNSGPLNQRQQQYNSHSSDMMETIRPSGNGNPGAPSISSRARAHSTSLSTVSTDDSVASRNSLVPRGYSDPIVVRPDGFYQGQPSIPVESFLMPTQDQYPADSLILFGGTAAHSEGGLFRKDLKEYLMLTNSSLLKYKTMEKATKVFGNQSVWSSSSGHQMLTPQQTSLISKDHRILSLNSIVGVHTIKPQGSDVQIVIEYLVSISSQPATMHFTPSPEQVEPWLKELRQGCNYHAPQAGLIPKGTRQRQWIAEKMQDDFIALPTNVSENHPTSLAAGGMWRAYFKSQKIKGIPVQENAPAEAKVALENKVVAIAVGTSYIRILPHNLGNSNIKEDMKDERAILQYPILTVRSIQFKEKDDTFTICFGTALRQRTVVITFVSARAREIIIAIRARVESLRWLYPLTRKGIELSMSEELSRPIPVPSKDYLPDLGFEDLLRAECYAMGVERSIFSNVHVDGFTIKVGKVGDTPETKRDYGVDEMKCLLRAMRYNTTFKEISFHDISFGSLHNTKTFKDGSLRYGLRMDQELYELIMANPQIRSLDLHNCQLDTSAIGSIGRAIKDAYPVGLRLESLNLHGNNASDGSDVMTLAKGIVKHAGTLHSLNMGSCHITGDGINQIMHAFVANPDVASHLLENFAIHNNSDSKVNSFILDMFLKHSMRLESLNLSELTSWSKSPILMAETLANCGGYLRLIDLSGMALHPSTLEQILTWLSSPGCESLEQLKVEGCGLDGNQFASILDAICQGGNSKIEVLAGRNLLSDGQDLPESLVSVLSNGETALSLGLRQTCWSEQALRQLFVSLSQNFTLKKLDISSVSLASSRDPDVETCKLLGLMISSPSSRLEELYIQGEETAELTSRMGRNLWRSFEGLGNSRYLTKLDVRRNRFKDEGAMALAEALRVNQSLIWLDMDENDVTIDGFNAILSAFHQGGTEQVPTSSRHYNTTLCYFETPCKDADKLTELMKESMVDSYKTEQETKFLAIHATGKDAREWGERLVQIKRQRQQNSDAISRLERVIQNIATVVDRNKAAMDAVIRDRERRRERERDQELLQQRREGRRA
ncbi:hypothetical protein BGZ46_008661 [Entomortierella lignicola]|nr:hypothetical protein BGZ46_008661 [Entomortierella lignicola]